MTEKAVIEFGAADVAINNGRMVVNLMVSSSCEMPEQDEHLLYQLEMVTEEFGRAFMRQYYKLMVEKADAELILSMRNKGIQRIGRIPYTIKTTFGTVKVPRIRINYRNGKTEIPSKRIWGIPRHLLISRGLKEEICQLVVKQSYGSTVQHLARESGEAKLISKSSVKNIVHREGAAISTAQSERAEAIYKADSDNVKKLIGEPGAQIAEDHFELVWLNGENITHANDEEIKEFFEQIDWQTGEFKEALAIIETISTVETAATIDPSPILSSSTAFPTPEPVPALTPPLIIVEPDEVVICSQDRNAGQYIVHYTAVVRTREKKHYLSAQTSAQLCWQIGNLLSVLGAGSSQCQVPLLILSDGASWIRNWVNSLKIENYQSILCWYHLNEHCWRLIRASITDKEARQIVKKALQKYLWRGQIEAAKRYLTLLIQDHEDGIGEICISDEKAFNSLQKYLNVRGKLIPNYQRRWKQGESIANRTVEAFNNHCLSQRCKKPKVRWSRKGVAGIAALTTITHNEEIREWRERESLPSWKLLKEQAA